MFWGETENAVGVERATVLVLFFDVGIGGPGKDVPGAFQGVLFHVVVPGAKQAHDLMDASGIEGFLRSSYNLTADARMLRFFTDPSALTVGIVGLLAVAGVVWRGAFCRWLCPYGALLGLLALVGPMSCFKYLALHTTVSGLGFALSDLYTIHLDGAWWRAFSGHSEPLLLLFGQVYRLVPDQAAPFVLLTAQALFLALPALATARRYGVLAALAYALYFPVWTNALNGFHPDHLLVPVLFAFLLAARSGRFVLAACLGLLPALVGEYQALTTFCCGLYLFAVHERHRAGLLLMEVVDV